MKKLIALILSLCFLLPCVAVTVAADAGYTLVLNVADDSSELTGDTVYELPTPTAPEGKVFAGWQGTLAGEQAFLPAGAEVTLTEDAALTAVFVGMQMNQKPQIRYDIEGLRFFTRIDKADLDALLQYATVGFGTLIVPKDSLKKNTSLTHSAIEGKTHLDIVTAGAYSVEEEIFWLAGSIGHVKTKNFCRAFLAAGYLSVTYSNGSTGYVYAPVKQSTTQPHLYRLSVEAFEGSAAVERTFLTRVLDAVVDLSLTCDKKNLITAIDCGPVQAASYSPVYTARYEKNADRIVITVKEGKALNYNSDYAAVILDGRIYDTAFEHDTKMVAIGTDGAFLHITWLGEYSDFY